MGAAETEESSKKITAIADKILTPLWRGEEKCKFKKEKRGPLYLTM